MPGALVIRPTNGLCNRMGVLASFAALARRSNRELQVCWTASRGWSDEDLEDLFENRFMRLAADHFQRVCAEDMCLHEHVSVDGLGGLNQRWQDSGAPGFAGVFDVASYPAVAYEGFRRCQDLLAPERRRRLLPGFSREFEAELRRLRPVSAIRRQVAELAAAFDDATVGVHIRRGDALSSSWARTGYGHSSDAAFMDRMDQILTSRPRSSFFLATDCFETEQRFRARYGDRILTNPDKRFVASVRNERKDNQHDAVVDLFTLAQTGRILGSYYSTFSTTAASIAGARLQVVVADSWLKRQRRRARYAASETLRRGKTLLERLPGAWEKQRQA